jgi:hypothetical protein
MQRRAADKKTLPMNKDLERAINKMMQEQNEQGIPDFEGYSPNEMHVLLHEPFGKKSPIRLQTMKPQEYASVPMLNQVRYLAGQIRDQGEVKLTSLGFLPVKMVKELYSQGFLKDDDVEAGITKLSKESDSLTINLPRILLELSGLAKIHSNKMSLTKRGEAMLTDDAGLLKLIFQTMCLKFKWAFYDGYEDERIGQLGFGFTLVLLSKYGAGKRDVAFYAKKYAKAFPFLMVGLEDIPYDSPEEYLTDCYSIRTFERFLKLFGLVTLEREKRWDAETFVTKTALFDAMIRVDLKRG